MHLLHCPKHFFRCLLVSGLLTIFPGTFPGSASTSEPGYLTLAHLKHLSECELNRLFEQGSAGEIPVGYGKGRVLLMTEHRMPRLRARLAGAAWKGKEFAEDGTFINQWPGFQALRSHAEHGISWYDGKPCIAIEYPPDTPLFGNSRDELRGIGPGLYLARLYERCPCPRFRGYFALQMECGKRGKHGR